MSNYHDYRTVKVMIAEALMEIEGWTVHDYYPDESDAMYDYWSPAAWGGIAEKNGYVLCVDVHNAANRIERRTRLSHVETVKQNKKSDIEHKIEKLRAMTVERGASEEEERSAKEKIETLLAKQKEVADVNLDNYEVIVIPAHLANPPRCNWHLEKDGVILLKGQGLLKFSEINSYLKYHHDATNMEEYRKNPQAYYMKQLNDYIDAGYHTREKCEKYAKEHCESMQKKSELMDNFKAFIDKLDKTCGVTLANDENNFIYEKVKVTEYKTENVAVERDYGELKEGQCFILKSNFTYGCNKGTVYMIHERKLPNGSYFYAHRMNSKLTKELKGTSTKANSWNSFGENFFKYLERKNIRWCTIETRKMPYEVEKVIKKKVESNVENVTQSSTTSSTGNKINTNKSSKNVKKQCINNCDANKVDIPKHKYTVIKDIDTRDNSTIYLVRIVDKLEREHYIEVADAFKKIGGYYSKFKHAFLFRNDPSKLIGVTN